MYDKPVACPFAALTGPKKCSMTGRVARATELHAASNDMSSVESPFTLNKRSPGNTPGGLFPLPCRHINPSKNRDKTCEHDRREHSQRACSGITRRSHQDEARYCRLVPSPAPDAGNPYPRLWPGNTKNGFHQCPKYHLAPTFTDVMIGGAPAHPC